MEEVGKVVAVATVVAVAVNAVVVVVVALIAAVIVEGGCLDVQVGFAGVAFDIVGDTVARKEVVGVEGAIF